MLVLLDDSADSRVRRYLVVDYLVVDSPTRAAPRTPPHTSLIYAFIGIKYESYIHTHAHMRTHTQTHKHLHGQVGEGI